MDASDEFRFISTSATGNGSSSARRPQRNGQSAGDTTQTNSLRSVPVCVYNENRSFKLRFFWDKAFKLFHSHRPVYRAVSGINYQDCGTIGSCTNSELLTTSSSRRVGGGGGTSLVKVRSQSHQQLNRVGNNEMEFIRGRMNGHSAATSDTTTCATTSRIVTTITSGSGCSEGTRLYYDNVNGHGGTSAESQEEFIPVVVPRRKHRAFGFTNNNANAAPAPARSHKNDSSLGNEQSHHNHHHQFTTNTAISISSTGRKSNPEKKKKHNTSHYSSLATRPVSSSISGGEKPQLANHADDDDGDERVHEVDGNNGRSDVDDDEESFYNNILNCDYDNAVSNSSSSTAEYANRSNTVSSSSTATGTSSSFSFPHSHNRCQSNNHTKVGGCTGGSPTHVPSFSSSHHHHSTVSATVSAPPAHLRRSQSAKSQSHHHHPHHRYRSPPNESQAHQFHLINSQNQKVGDKTCVLTRSSSSSNSRNVPSPTCSSYESWKSFSAGSAKSGRSRGGGSGSVGGATGCGCPCHSSNYFYQNNNPETDRGSCNYCDCSEQGYQHHHHHHHQVDEDSDTIGNDSGLDTWKKSSPSGSVMKNGSEEEESGIVCTISQRIPSGGEQESHPGGIEEPEYCTVADAQEEEEGHTGGGSMSGGCGGSVNIVDDNERNMIENGSVMYDSLDETYSVPPLNGNTTVVLINGCCEVDHCQNATLSDTFNFSDYDVECMSEIDLNSESGSGPNELGNGGGGGMHPPPSSSTGNTNGESSNYVICHSTSENELDSLDLAMFETNRGGGCVGGGFCLKKEVSSSSPAAGCGEKNKVCSHVPLSSPSNGTDHGESCGKVVVNGKDNSLNSSSNTNNNHNLEDNDRSSSLCAQRGGVVLSSQAENSAASAGPPHLVFAQQMLHFGTNNSTCGSITSVSTVTNSKAAEDIYTNWSDAGSEFEFVAAPPPLPPGNPPPLFQISTGLNRDIPMGHSPRGNPPDVEWEPYFCVLNQLDQTFTSYRSEEMSIFPGTPTRPRTQTNVFGENGISPTEIPRVRLDGGPNSIKCLINNAKWGMNPLMEEEEESNNTTVMASSSSNNGNDRDKASGDYSSSSGSSSNQRPNSSPTSPLDTSYDKACGSERRGSAPLTPLLGRDTPSRFANFFSKRSFKSNPLKRTKSVTKLERKKASGVIEPESSTGNILYPSRMRISRSHESLLAWTNNPVNSFVSNGMMSTMDLTAGDVSIRPLHPSLLGQEHAFQVTTPAGSKYYTCSSAAERDSWVYAFRQAIRPRADEVRRRENALKIWILEGKGIPGTSSGKQSSKRYFCELYLDDVLYARTCGKQRGEMLFWGEHFEFTQLPNCVQLITVVFFREGDKKRKKERNTCIGKVKIPVNSVTSRYLIEKWYPVLPESSSHSSKEKEHPSLRIKCKYQSVDILPLRCYKSFLQYVKDQYGPLSECLESVLSVKAKEDLASAMVHVLHSESLAKEFIAELALQEILKSGDEKLTFRGNSIATKAMEAFLKLTGTEYLHATLGPFIEQFQGSEDLYDCEIDPMKLPVGANLAKNQQNLRMAVDTVWKAIMHSHSIFPIELRECFSHCREALKSAGKEELSDHLISASIFLRFLCPAILSPSLFNITNEYPSEKSARNLTLIAKVLQTLANFTRFQGKENYMEFINDFVEREASNMKAFLSCISSPLNPEAVKKAQKEARDKVPAGGFIDLGKYLSILSTLLSENVAKIAPKNDRFKHLQELLETIHKWLEQPANATNVAMFPFPHLPSPPPSGPPPPAPLGIPMNHRFSNPLCNNNTQAINHQYQIPHHIVSAAATPIYAVSSVIHNNSNPNVKNISQVQMNMNGNCIAGGGGVNGVPPYPLQLQIPHANNPNQIGINNNRSGSQASSGYQSQSPVLEGEDKAKKSTHIKDQINAHINNINLRATEMQDATTALTFNNPVFNRKAGSQSVDDLSTVGVEKNEENAYPRRLTRSSSSSDCEYTHSNISPTKGRPRGQAKLYANNGNISGQQPVLSKSQSNKPGHHRLSRRSSAELLRKNHPYSSSSDEDSDSGLVNEREEQTPHLPPRRNHIKRNSGHRPVPDGSSTGEKSLEEYEREMSELRRAMEALQAKLSRAEERLFGNESPGQKRMSGEMALGSPGNSGGSGNGSKDRYSRSSDDGCKEVDQLLQRLLSAEEEMKREHDLLTALDKKQKLIDAQEQKIARLDSVNNQLLQALAQIRDSLQQQHVQQQQQKIQQQLLKQQQHLKNLANGFVPACNHTVHQSSVASQNSLNNNGSLGNRPTRPNQLQFAPAPAVVHRDSMRNPNMKSNGNCNANTTKVLITSSSSESLSQATGDSNSDSASNNRDSSALLGEQALQMLAELRSSSC